MSDQEDFGQESRPSSPFKTPTYTRRQAAEEWMRSMGYRAMAEPAPPEIEEAHIAGQECGEQRGREAERAATVKWLRMIEKRTRDYSRPSTESLLVADEYDYIARTIMSGEHREG